MSSDRGRHAATVQQPRPLNDRREHLTSLKAAVDACPGVEGGVVERRGVLWLNIVRHGSRRTVEVGCDFRDGRWWFCKAGDGTTIAPVEDINATINAITHDLDRADR